MSSLLSTFLLSKSACESEVRAREFLPRDEVTHPSFMSLREKHSQGQNQIVLKDNSKQTHTLSFGSVSDNMTVSGFVSCHLSALRHVYTLTEKAPNPLTQ